MPALLKSAAALVVGLTIGLLATWLTVVRGTIPGGVSNGAWRTSLAIGSVAGDPYTRAAVALHGLLALSRSEALYYNADSDDSGARLDPNCRYEISGKDPDARWWSITAYADDGYLIANPAHHYSVSRNSVERGPDATFQIMVAREGASKNFISLGKVRDRFSLTLRLYNPGTAVVQDPAHVSLPRIRKVSCI